MSRNCRNSFSRLTVSAAIVLAVIVPMTMEALVFKELGDLSIDKNCQLTINCNKPLFTKNVEVFGIGYCQEEKQKYNCVHYYAQKCLSPDLWPVHFAQYNISMATVEDLCSKTGLYRHDYARHYNCINSIEAQNDKCDSLLETKNAANETVPIEHGQCESHKMYIQCIHSIVKTNCGAEIAAFTRHVLSRLGSMLLNYCDEKQENGHETVIGMPSSPPEYDDESVDSDNNNHTSLYIILIAIIFISVTLGIIYFGMTNKCRINQLRDFDYMKVVLYNAHASEPTSLP